MAENVKVAVRVRPFNQRELNKKAKLIIQMRGNTTAIMDPVFMDKPGVEPKKFTFDYSYWSHDGFSEREDGYLFPTEPSYADQNRVFDDLGRGVLENAWKGYNCSLFAYGQTGSGKSYSMVGYGANKGIVPVTCEELFKGIEEKKGSRIEFQVVLNMLEIYNEQVRDLLNPVSNVKGGLKVREHPSRGFYVDGARLVPVKTYEDIEERIAEGTKNRTIASTNMNATSSRAHTIVSVTFTQKSKNELGQNMARTSIINLVDLAGSERADSTGAVGQRLQEGAAINKSLSTLGNVIKALADGSTGKKVLVPYRDSTLTKLLKNALGGNSKTIMIAALSPADINFEETLSTLRFADRAKSIKTKATVNESPTDKLIRELRTENARLLEMLKKGNFTLEVSESSGASEEEIARMRKQMEEELAQTLEVNRREMGEMQKSWEQRLAESQQVYVEKDKAERQKQVERKTTPHFWNLNEDPQLSNMVVHLAKPGLCGCVGVSVGGQSHA